MMAAFVFLSALGGADMGVLQHDTSGKAEGLSQPQSWSHGPGQCRDVTNSGVGVGERRGIQSSDIITNKERG
jgi:hypothetical protein